VKEGGEDSKRAEAGEEGGHTWSCLPPAEAAQFYAIEIKFLEFANHAPHTTSWHC